MVERAAKRPDVDRHPTREAGLEGLMMDFPLTVTHILRRMKTVHGRSQVTTLLDPETQTCVTSSFAEVVERAGQLANALRKLGVRPGDRVGSLAWNNVQHLEVYLAVTCMGAVLHTLNLRLHPDQLRFTVDHAEDCVLIVEDSLTAQVAELLPGLSTVKHVVTISQGGAGNSPLVDSLDYAELLANEPTEFAWPELDERAAAALCYTSGTTGDPKGVLYSHRSIVLHALAMAGADAYGLSGRDRVLALVPLFHAMGWGLPFVCGLVGADLVFPGPHVRPAALGQLIENHQVTWSCGVPTIWLDLLAHVEEQESHGRTVDLSTLHTVLCGGTAVPEGLIRDYESRYDVAVIQGWGMTEIFPGAAVGRDQAHDTDEARWEHRRAAGRLSPIYEVRLVDPTGGIQPHDGTAVGEFEVRGPAVSSSYFRSPEATVGTVDNGWLRTGDVGTVDEEGWMRITDRAKDVIKSGGEWISSLDLEGALMSHPGVREAAVIGKADDRWGERPVAYVVLDGSSTIEELREYLLTKVARWWVPDDYRVIEAIPRNSTGKFDKKALREQASRTG